MCLDDKLLDPNGRCFGFEFAQNGQQFVVDPHGQVDGQTRAEAHTLHLGIFLAIGAFLVRFSFVYRHFVDGVEDMAQRFVLTHQRIASGDEDIPQLRIFLEIFHQFTQSYLPAFFGFQVFEVEVQSFALEVVHTLARCAQSAARASHGVGDEDGHFGVAAMDVVAVGEQPSRGIRFACLD